MKYLVVVDMQNDFIDMALGTDEAQRIVPYVKEYIENFDGEVIFTKDTHSENYLSTQEGKNLPVVHCVKGTLGWEICDELLPFAENRKVFEKKTFGSVELAQYMSSLDDIESVTLLGLCTDICVISNAYLIKAYMPEVKVSVVKNCCAGVTEESHERALAAMAVCQIDVI